MPQEYIDQFLLTGSNTDNARTRLAIEYSKQLPMEKMVDFIQKTYHGGYGLTFGETKVSAWYGEDGMHLAYGTGARYARTAQILSWEDMYHRIGELLDQGRFATNVELAEMRSFERKELAEKLWYMDRDINHAENPKPYMSIVRDLRGGFPDDTAKLMVYLSEPESYKVNYSPFTAEWNITGKKNIGYRDINANTTYGTSRINAYQILEDSLNLRDVQIHDVVEDSEGREKRVLNQKETTLAQQKQESIRDAFKDWIWKDPERRQALVQQYNEIFNSTRPREYDGSHITFGGMSPEITLREHQQNAIAHILYGGNTLLAHEVGSGKTFEMVAAAMESKRLGLCSKSLIAVPNHLTEQWASEFLRLYPSANILVARKKDFEPARRKTFCAKIATGDYDAIIMGHSQFEKIPISMERQQ